jgi:hypothetical protein
MSQTTEQMWFDSLKGRKRFLQNIQTESGANTSSCVLLTVAAFPRDKLVQTINLHRIEVALKYWGTTLKNRSCIREEIKSSLKSGSGFWLPVQNLQSSGLL